MPMGIDLQKPTSLYKQIAGDLRTQIEKGEMVAGDQLPSQGELAKRYDVSLITIKKALSELIGNGLIYSRMGKGAFVAPRQTQLKLNTSKALGLVLRDLRSPFFSMIIHSVQAEAERRGYTLLISNSADHEEREVSQIARFRSMEISGMIIASMSYTHEATPPVLKLMESKFPMVMVSYIEDDRISYVGIDNLQGAYLATKHLVDLGYSRIGYISGGRGNVLSTLRMEGYQRALKDAGLPVDRKYLFELPVKQEWRYYDAARALGHQILGLKSRPEAIFAYDDMIALGLQQAVLEIKLQVPDDLAIVGFDDIEQVKLAPVPLTTIRQPVEEIGERAVGALTAQIDGRKEATRILLNPRLVIRESCGSKLFQKSNN